MAVFSLFPAYDSNSVGDIVKCVSERITVADYLLARLAELGIDTIFGVPGDYNLGFLNRVLATPNMSWVGCANELNAAYAADGYARIRGFGAVATTFGVGELSAINGVAGAYAENVPVIEITGGPASTLVATCSPVHHTFADGDFKRFARAYAEVTCATMLVTDAGAANEIDTVLRACMEHRLPVHLTIPSDVALVECAAPTVPLSIPKPAQENAAALDGFAREVKSLIAKADVGGRPEIVLLADHQPARWAARDALRALVDELDLPTAVLHRGKGVLDETHPGFLGLYAGDVGSPEAQRALHHADIVIAVGGLFTGGIVPFTEDVPAERLISVYPHHTDVAGTQHHIGMTAVLPNLAKLLPRSSRRPAGRADCPSRPKRHGVLTQDSLWSLIESNLQPGDILAPEAGTAYYGALGIRLLEDAEVISQGLWSSIGYTLPAVLGAELAAVDRRAILVIGDGSLQLTAQELGTIIRLNLVPLVIVLNNAGYTVERLLHDATAPYNDIADWNWQLLPQAFGAMDALIRRATTCAEFESALREARANPGRLAFIEAVLPQLDAPAHLAEAVAKRTEKGRTRASG